MIKEKIKKTYPCEAQKGRPTALEAFRILSPIAMSHDRQAFMTMIVSGEDIDAAGRSYSWEFLFHFPVQEATGVLSVHLDPAGLEEDREEFCITEEITPLAKAGGFLESIFEKNPVFRSVFTKKQKSDLARKPALPVPFRDSPEAVNDIASRGVDFAAGDSHTVLTGEIATTGEAVWKAVAFDVEYRTHFLPL